VRLRRFSLPHKKIRKEIRTEADLIRVLYSIGHIIGMRHHEDIWHNTSLLTRIYVSGMIKAEENPELGSYESTCEKDAVMSLSITIEPSPYCTEIVYFPFVYCLRFKDYVKISQSCSVEQFARIRFRVCHEMYYQYRHFETAIRSDVPLLAF